MKQTEDQYSVAALREQLSNVANAKQGNSTNNKWYDQFNTKVEVAESVGVSFDFEKMWEFLFTKILELTLSCVSQATQYSPSRKSPEDPKLVNKG